MTTEHNGHATPIDPDAGWAIFIHGGFHCMGRARPRPSGGHVLAPAYNLACLVNATPDGRMSITYQASPVLFLASLRELEIPAGAIRIPFEDLDADERKMLRGAIAQADEMVKGMRAAKAGLLLSTRMPPGHAARRPG
jgi:hypothetical protein